MFNTKFVDLFVTTICDLKCKYCGTFIPYAKEKRHLSFDWLAKQIDAVFDVWDSMEIFQFMGGEPLQHPDFEHLILKALEYNNKFMTFRITTNGTVMLDEHVLICLSSAKQRGVNVELLISDYGLLSSKIEELTEACVRHNISFQRRKYTGDEQYCGGWVDYGDFTYKTGDVLDRFKKCACPINNIHEIYNGKVYNCARGVAGEITGRLPAKSGIVDLLDETPLEDKRRRLSRYGKAPYYVCRYCNGLLPNESPRVPAAEQL